MKDKFPSLEALKSSLRELVDYRIRLADRKSWATIISPHGGFIEPGTSSIAAAVAATDFNLYDFQGLKTESPSQLHVTATRFRDPQLDTLLNRSAVAVSIHSMGPQQESVIWLGGRNRLLKGIVLDNLRMRGFAVEPNSPRYKGESPKNVVNQAREEGVQLELSDELIAQLFVGSAFSLAEIETTTERFACLVSALQCSLKLTQNTTIAQ